LIGERAQIDLPHLGKTPVPGGEAFTVARVVTPGDAT
jgi:hypothetical protein